MASNPNIFGESFPIGTGSIPTFGVPSCMLELGLDALRLLPGDALATIMMSMNEGVLAARSVIADIKAEILEFLGLAQDEKDGLTFFKIDSGWAALGDAIAAVAGAISFINELAAQAQAFADQIQDIKDCLSDYETHLKRQRGSDAALAPTEALMVIYEAQIYSAEKFVEDATALMADIVQVLNEREQGIGNPEDLLTGADADVEVGDDGIFRLTYGPPRTTKGTFLLSVDGLYYDSQNRTYASSGSVPTIEDLQFVPDSSRWKLDHSPNLGGKGTQITLGDLNRYVDTILDPNLIDDSSYLKEYYNADHLIQVLEGHKNLTISQLDSQRESIAEIYDTSSAVYINMQQQIFSEIELFDIKLRKRKKQIELAVKAPDLFGVSSMFSPGNVPVNDFSYLSDINLSIEVEKQKKLVIDQGDISGVVLPFKPTFVTSKASQNGVAVAPIKVNKNITGSFVDISPYSESDSSIVPVLTLNDPIVTDGLVSVYNFLETEVEDTGSIKYNVTNCTGDSRQNLQLVSKSRSSAFPKGLGIPRFSGIVKFDSDEDSFIRRSEHGTYGRLPQTSEIQNLLYNPKGCSFDFWLHMPNLASGLNSFEVKVFDQGLAASSQISSLTLNSETAAWTDFNFFKAILCNENTGGRDLGQDSGSVLNNFSTDAVRGMFIGFTRSPIFTIGGLDTDADNVNDTFPNPAGSMNPFENYEGIITAEDSTKADNTYFLIAPMQSFSKEGCSFIRNEDCSPNESEYRGLKIPITKSVNGVSLTDCSSGFMHMSITFNFEDDTITVYLNGNELESSSVSNVFGTDKGKPISIPTFAKVGGETSSFSYPGSIPIQESEDFLNGPRLDQFFTPWIVGGGWTDGFPLKAEASKGSTKIIRNLNELGANSITYGPGGYEINLSSIYGGFSGPSNGMSSGLGGHLGSLKIYSKPLSNNEVSVNYDAHKTFFSNIKTINGF